MFYNVDRNFFRALEIIYSYDIFYSNLYQLQYKPICRYWEYIIIIKIKMIIKINNYSDATCNHCNNKKKYFISKENIKNNYAF